MGGRGRDPPGPEPGGGGDAPYGAEALDAETPLRGWWDLTRRGGTCTEGWACLLLPEAETTHEGRARVYDPLIGNAATDVAGRNGRSQ